VLERNRLAAIDTGHTTAHLTCVLDTPLSTLVQSVGEDHARAAWDAGLAALAQVDHCVRAEQLDCDFAWVPGYLHAPIDKPVDAQTDRFLRKEADTAAGLGFDARYLDRVPLMNRPGLVVSGQARIHPLRYLAGLVRAITADEDGAIFEHTAAEEVTERPLTVVAGAHRVTCDYVVVATHNPIAGKASLLAATVLQTKLALYSSYAIAARVETGQVPDALFWDTGDPYRYLRTERRQGFDSVIWGGEDHKTGQADDVAARFERLSDTLAGLVPEASVTHRWSGQVIETADGLPFIGEIAPRQHVATGFSGNGITLGTVGGMMACDAALGRPNPWTGLFDPDRTNIRAGAWDYLRENKDYPYYLIRDRFAGPDGRSLREVPRGSGRLLDIDGRRVAAYRDLDGTAHVRSATCPHMGCHVHWNDVERTWDCPCHGSRFTPTGEVLSGPAERPLAGVDKD
jgi:glycine/D-amino acid oxidase-like deaminating enzyme/nitrite reductase/ring-hydroxylating ferredoxin subunit